MRAPADSERYEAGAGRKSSADSGHPHNRGIAFPAAGPVIQSRQNDVFLISRQRRERLGVRLEVDSSTISGIRYQHLHTDIFATDFWADANRVLFRAYDLGMKTSGRIIA